MKAIVKYLFYVIRHRWFVFLECYKAGIPGRGLVHDLSKFLPSEFFPYAQHFYGKGKQGIKTGRDKTGYYKPGDTGDVKFDFAWLLHQKRNRHHWEWWVMPDKLSGVILVTMHYKTLIEMVCDWKGAGRAQGHGDDVQAWYAANKEKMMLNEFTRQKLELILDEGAKK